MVRILNISIQGDLDKFGASRKNLDDPRYVFGDCCG